MTGKGLIISIIGLSLGMFLLGLFIGKGTTESRYVQQTELIQKIKDLMMPK